MLVTLVYILGALSLHFTDLHSESAFLNLLLPGFNLLFFIFIVWQLIFYFSLHSFGSEDHPGLSSLILQIWNLDLHMQRNGILPALFTLAIMLVNAASLFTAVFYYISTFLDFIAMDNGLTRN